MTWNKYVYKACSVPLTTPFLCSLAPTCLFPCFYFFDIPLFAFLLLICANHHETTATLEPLTGVAWHPAPL